MLAVLVVLAALGWFSLESFYIASFLGFVTLFKYSGPFTVRVRWHDRLKWVLGGGLVVFSYLLGQRLLTIIPPQVLS
jgi:hypothetical protein